VRGVNINRKLALLLLVDRIAFLCEPVRQKSSNSGLNCKEIKWNFWVSRDFRDSILWGVP
jgi:hypothetical protein